jgi:hypothetical protein
LLEEQNEAETAKAQKEAKLSADVQSFLTGLSAVTDSEVDAVFAASVPALEE